MNFEFSPADQAFAEKVRGFLRAHPPETFPVDGMDAGHGLVLARPRPGRAFATAMARGDRLCPLALTEERASFEREAVALEGEAGDKLSGRKLFVNDVHVADGLIVVTLGAAGANLLLLDARRPGITVLIMEAMAGGKPCEVSFAGVEVRADDLIGEAGRGWDLLVPALRAGALARTAEMVGCAPRILELCVEHAKARKQFGRPVGSFQAVQQRHEMFRATLGLT